jgi:hypothetical protein
MGVLVLAKVIQFPGKHVDQKYPTGTKIYNRGDMANQPGWYVITGFISDEWGKFYTLTEIDGDRISERITERTISDIDKGNGLTRFVTEEAYNTYRAESIKRSQESIVKAIGNSPTLAVHATPNRNETIMIIRQALKQRSGKSWSVTGGKGTAYGWITIDAPPARRVNNRMTESDQKELAALLGLPSVHFQGATIAASSDYREEYIARARGEQPEKIAQPYWD